MSLTREVFVRPRNVGCGSDLYGPMGGEGHLVISGDVPTAGRFTIQTSRRRALNYVARRAYRCELIETVRGAGHRLRDHGRVPDRSASRVGVGVMRSSGISVGLQIGTQPPLSAYGPFLLGARAMRLDSIMVIDHFQNVFPSVIWDRELTWLAAQRPSPHEIFDYQVLLGYLALPGRADAPGRRCD